MSLERELIVPYPDPLPYSAQSVEVPGTRKPGQTGHYRNGAFGLLSLDTPGMLTTLDRVFEAGLKLGGNRPFLGHRPLVSTQPVKYADSYTWISYGEADRRRRNIGSALVNMFEKGELGGGEYETVGIWSINRPEWQLVDTALQGYRKVSVSLYDTLGKDSAEYIINHAHLSVVFSSFEHVPTLLKSASKTPCLKLVVSLDDLSPESSKVLSSWGQSIGVKVMDLRSFETIGASKPREVIRPSPHDLASICYTSGTTGNPKGVMLSHANLSTACHVNLYGTILSEEGALLSYLPLAHIYGRVCELCIMAVGGRIGYFTGDPLRLLEDAQILRPNFFPSVPRVLNRVYQSAMLAGAAGGVKGALFNKAVQAKLEKLHATGDNTHFFWDKLIFRKIQAVLGGNLKMVTTGSAPISTQVMDFLKVAFACDVSEGYGMTENAATCTKCWPNDPSSSGTVGPPQPCNEIKLVDVPAMGYTSLDKPYPRGELCVRGINCFKQYYKDEKNTTETVDADGWTHTGDVAEIDARGRFRIVDRVKNIMKLAQGEYVALEKIENLYAGAPIVAQIYVHGDSLQSYLLAVVVPDPVQLAGAVEVAVGEKVDPADVGKLEGWCRDERVVQHVLGLLTKEAKKNELKGFEMVKRIHLSLEPFSVENNTMTPTFKIRRKDAFAKYKAPLDALYTLGDAKL